MTWQVKPDRKQIWIWGWDLRHPDGGLYRFAHLYLGLWFISKDTEEPWSRGWSVHSNADC